MNSNNIVQHATTYDTIVTNIHTIQFIPLSSTIDGITINIISSGTVHNTIILTFYTIHQFSQFY